MNKGKVQNLVIGCMLIAMVLLVGNVALALAQAQSSGITTRVSVASDGTQANGASSRPSISADGRYVAFVSSASNLVNDDTNGLEYIFVHDRQTGETTRVTVGLGSGEFVNLTISADGRYVVFKNGGGTFIHDRQTGQTSRVSDGAPIGGPPTISSDNRYVAFANGCCDIFVHDRLSSQTTRVSVASDGTQGNGRSWSPVISADGRYVAFASSSSNLVSGDTNDEYKGSDIFVHDRQTLQTTRVSDIPSGDPIPVGIEGVIYYSNYPSISADGRYVAFIVSDDVTTGGVFVHDRITGQTKRVSSASDTYPFPHVFDSNISADGQYVSFLSMGDVFVHDLQTEKTILVSVSSDGVKKNMSFEAVLSADGRYVAFSSLADNLVSGDSNNTQDVFVHERQVSSPIYSFTIEPSAPSIKPGETIIFNLNASGKDLFGIEAILSTTPNLLKLAKSEYGNIFDPQSRLEIPIQWDDENGMWKGAMSLRRPAEPFTGQESFAILKYTARAGSYGEVDIIGDVIFSDINGNRLPVVVQNATITIDDGIHGGNGVITGNITIPGSDDHSGILVTIYKDGNTYTAETDKDGNFSFKELIEGTFTITATYPLHVFPCTTAVITGDEPTVHIENMTMLAGDLNGDGIIDIGDFTLMAGCFGTSVGDDGFDERADINGDGTVNIQDLSILGGHFGLETCRPVADDNTESE